MRIIIESIVEKIRSNASIIFLIISLVNILLCMFTKEFYKLSENQILYIYTDIAQIAAAIMGIILATYPLVDGKIRERSENSNDSIVEKVRKNSFNVFATTIILCLLIISNSILTLGIFETSYARIISFFMNESILCFGLLLVLTLCYVWILSPNYMNQISCDEKKKIEEDYNLDNSIGLGEFLTCYNKLESIVKKYALELSTHNINIKDTTTIDDGYMPKFLDSIHILKKNKIINQITYERINEIRRYKNTLVHSLSENKDVNTEIFNILKTILVMLEDRYIKEYESMPDSSDMQSTIIISNVYTSKEKSIIEYVSRNSNASISDISKGLYLSVSTVIHIIKKLERGGILTRDNAGKWIVYTDIPPTI